MGSLGAWMALNAITLLLMGGVFAYLHRVLAAPGLRAFSVGFTMGGLGVIGIGLEQAYGYPLLGAVAGLLMLFCTMGWAIGAFETAGSTLPVPLRIAWGLGFAWVPIGVALGLSSVAVIGPLALVLAASLVAGGVAIIASRPSSVSAWMAGSGQVLLGLHVSSYPLLMSQAPEYQHLGYLVATLLDSFLAMGLISSAYERARDALVEREKQLASARRLEAVGRLAGGVAHDFNNLLTVILGNLELAKLDPRSSGLTELLDAATEAGEQASKLTSQLVALGKSSVRRRERVDLDRLLSEALASLHSLLPEATPLSVVLLGEPAWIRADPDAFRQVLVGLVSNARDAVKSGGVIHVGVHRAGSELILTVRDTGIGMTADTLDRIFEPFYSTKEMGRGTGLGLATVRAMVVQMNGRIEVESEPGEGTTFTIVLEEVEPPDDLTPEVVSRRRTARILLVEDEAPVRTIAQKALLAAGHTVLCAGDGQEALEILAAQGPFDLVISDMIMPRLDGLELTRRLRVRAPETAVLIVSGFPKGQLPEQVPFLSKPYTAQELRDAATRALPLVQ